MNRRLGLVALAIVLGAVGCQLVQVADYFPFALGYFWKYRLTSTTTYSGTIDTTFTRTDSLTTTVTATATVQGKSGWEVKTEYGLDGGWIHYYVKESNRLLSYDSLTDASPSTIQLPFSQGATWVSDSYPSLGKTHMTVEAKEAVTVPAGNFADVWRVKSVSDSTPNTTLTTWYANRVGTVKARSYMTYSSGGVTVTSETVTELMDYKTD